MNQRQSVATALLIILSTWFSIFATSSGLPETELSWKNVSGSDFSTATHCFYLDSDGMVWVGTNDGLCFYDGITVHKVNSEKLAGAQIFAIVEHGKLLYLGTNHGLLAYDNKNGIIKMVGNGVAKEIRCLLPVDDTLWIGSLYGVYMIDFGKGDHATPLSGTPHKSTYSLLRDTRGIIYAGTFNGLAKWDTVKEIFVPISSPSQENLHQNLFVNCLLESEDGRSIYVGSEGNLYKYRIASDDWEAIPQFKGNNIKSLARIDNGHLLIGTDNGVYDTHRDTIRHYRHDSRQGTTLADNEIWCLLTDSDRNVWAGHGRGFSISSHSNSIRTLRLSSLVNTGEGNEISSILRSRNGDLWLGGTNGVLQITMENGSTWHRHDNRQGALSHNRIRAIDEDSDGNIWLSTDGGLNRYNPKNGTFEIFHAVDSAGGHNSNWVYAMEEDKDSYWIGGFLSGLHRVSKSKFNVPGGIVYADISLNSDDSRNHREHHRLENDLVNDIVIDKDGSVWILLFRDDILACYDLAKDVMNRYNIYELSGNYPSKVGKDRRGRIWCVFNGGAVIFSGKDKPRIIRFADSGESNTPLALGAVGDDMWISTHTNVWKVDGNTFEATILPIPQKSYSAVYGDELSGKVLLGGVDEIIEVDPLDISGISGLKDIRILFLTSGGQEDFRYGNVMESREISIPYGGNISLVVSTLEYSPETVHRYMYKLATSETDTVGGWTILPEGMNTISFTDLKMGNFKILVKRVGMGDSPVAIPLKVKAPLFLSWWAILFYVVFVGAVIAGIVWYLHNKNRRRLQEEERKKSLDNVEKKLTFLSNISHDLKTPLSMILGPVSLMKEKTRDSEVKKTLETVYDNAVRLNNMIHKTIELRHMEDADDSLLIMSIFDVVEFCRDVFEAFKESNPQKKFIFHSACNKIFIEGDAVKFESVMTNLLSNACKYSDEGATITCGISHHGGNAVEIVVSDDGMGIEDNDQPLVFQRMFRAPSTSKLKEGTGLGLYLIKKYLGLMRGNISLYSKKGEGTSFIVTLPVKEKVEVKSCEVSDEDENDLPKVLVVEDNSEISSFISMLLGNEYTILTAENGKAGLAIASSFLPDIIIADEMMPIMTGLEMCKRMKQIPRLASIPVIMLTAKTDNQTENESVKLGIDVFMPKPFEPNLLYGRIRHLLKSRKDIKEKIRIQTLTDTKPIEAESATEKQLAKIAKIIEDNISDPDLNVNYLCEKSGMPQKQLYRIIKKYMDVAPLDYIRRVRLQKAALLLGQKRFTVSEICYMVGFKTPSYFSKCFQAQYGVKPSQYEGEDADISNAKD